MFQRATSQVWHSITASTRETRDGNRAPLLADLAPVLERATRMTDTKQAREEA